MRLEDLASAMLERDALRARSLVQDLVRAHVDLAHYPAPQGVSSAVRTMMAALLELLAERQGVAAPLWTAGVGALPEPFYTNAHALSSPKMRARSERESPAPLRTRNIFAFADVLTFA